MNPKCKICDTIWGVKLLSNFRPYIDVNWIFPIYECENCGVRFAVRDSKESYHELLHTTLGGGYASHYCVAQRVKDFLRRKELNRFSWG